MHHKDRNARIIASVEAGATFLEAARAHGVSRNAVAGIWHRAGKGMTEKERSRRLSRPWKPRTPEGEARRMKAVREWWANPNNRALHGQIMRRIWAERREAT